MAYYIGFDIGGTKCAVSLGETVGEEIFIRKRYEVPTSSSPEDTMERLAPYVAEMQKDKTILSAGISCGGPLDGEKGVILTPPNLVAWHGFPIVAYIKEKFGLCAKLENDANACGVAEWRFGAGRGCKNMIFLTFGTGLGAGLILDGKLYSGTNGNAGEAGHIRLTKYGPYGYGKYGAFEGYCSGGGIARLAKQMAKRYKITPECMVEMGDNVTTKGLAEAAFSGDSFAQKVFAKSGDMLGSGLSILVDLFNPERIVLGGVFMRSDKLLVPAMKKRLERETLPESLAVCEIVKAQLSENIGDYAALAVAMEV